MSGAQGPSTARRASRRPALAVFALLAALTVPPYVIAGLAPPPGRVFVGNFHWIDDFYNYLSFVEQAEAGAVLFRNKTLLVEHDAVLVNLEWWAVGRLSAWLGGHPFLAYRLAAVLALLAFLLGCDRLLRRGGLPEACRAPALLLVSLGGGLGGWLFELTELPVWRCLDLSLGLFPFVEILSNPHWIVARALFVWALIAALEARGWRGHVRFAALGTLLALVRPYDFVLLGAVRVLGVLLSSGPAPWPGRLWPLAGLLPAAAYDLWLFYASRGFSAYADFRYAFPALPDYVWALGPAALLALSGLRRAARAEQREVVVHLGAWVVIACAIVALRPVNFALQFAVGLGTPLLGLAALGLARRGARSVLLATLALCVTTAVALRIVLTPDPNWFVPRERLDAALVLRAHCSRNELALAAEDIGLYVGGLSACRPFLSQALAPDFARRLPVVQEFYGDAPPELRKAFLDRLDVRFLVLPGDAGDSPDAWLGQASGFRRIARLGEPPGVLSVYRRMPSASERQALPAETPR